MDINKLLPGVKKNIFLRNCTTFKIGGPAKYFFIAKEKNELINAVKWAKEKKLPFFMLGGGSNILVSDKGFNGLAIKNENCKLKIENCKIISNAGMSLGKLVSVSTEKGLGGLEWAAGIPGTLGGAIYGNAGWPSNKKNISSVIESVEALEINSNLKIRNFKAKECKFSYRDSIFKKNKNLIILSAVLKFKKRDKKKIKGEILKIMKSRREKIPTGFSAGSVFKNPKSFSAGELIEKCGLKGKKIGNARISEKHANFIINLGNAEAKDVRRLINLIKRSVKNKFGLILEEEIQYL